MEYLVNISKRRTFWSLNEDILKINDSNNQYAVSIKKDTAYPCLHSPKTIKDRRSIRRIQKNSIRRIQDIVSESRLRPYHFIYPERSLTMEEMLNKFINEEKQEHEEMRAFIYDFQTTNELLFKERNNSLIELRFGVQEFLKVINNVPMIDCDVKGVTTRGGKTMTQDVHDNNANVVPKEPLVVELEKPVGSNKVLTNNQP
ncbi:hypothetical protein Tco_0954300 [Tanacetum coccineum]|uniref:Uncharacterized protein n=1 Tax=Tanacetum coccineum TaxID=301880 RepID=A0ABQ5E2C7_9ASTR